MLLIATDEAGYGPKLGPLVIAAAAFRLPGDDMLGSDTIADLFAPLRSPRPCGGQTVVVDDSKHVYKPSSGLGALHAVVSASAHWCGDRPAQVKSWLLEVADQDSGSIARAPWLQRSVDGDLLSRETTADLLGAWRASGIELVDVKARVITAEVFNQACDAGANKADLLSETTLRLAGSLVDAHADQQRKVAVYCDRHGGRRYYAGVLQHAFSEMHLQVVGESKTRSAYRMTDDSKQVDVYFTVKGDSFTPVALASMHAKYIRERWMESFNAYFAARHHAASPLKPTAGYPVDADRFLNDIEPILLREQLDRRRLVRNR